MPNKYQTYEPESSRDSVKTFIACGAIPGPIGTYAFFEGDERGFGYAATTSRTFQSYRITVNPVQGGGLTGASVETFGTTRGFNNENLNDINPCLLGTCESYCQYCVDTAATAECIATAVNDQSGNELSAIGTRIDESRVDVALDTVGKNPCVFGAPAIDAHLVFEFRQVYNAINGVLGPMEWRLKPGSDQKHDGFPWHELYLNGIEGYRWDPCAGAQTPDPGALFGDGDISIISGQTPSAPELMNWQAVPGQ